ncbi:MAG: hypothetical protein OXH41_05255 [Chloroflexi bacterium]|nr:hypothetical protein [Chloroflexota bacterium]
MVVNYLLNRDAGLTVERNDEPDLARQTQGVLPPTISSQRMEAKGSHLLDFGTLPGFQQGIDSLDEASPYLRAPLPNRPT